MEIDIANEEAARDAMHEKQTCENCGRELEDQKIVWLELSNTDGNYYEVLPGGHVSQGGFPFGKACSTKILKQNGRI